MFNSPNISKPNDKIRNENRICDACMFLPLPQKATRERLIGIENKIIVDKMNIPP